MRRAARRDGGRAAAAAAPHALDRLRARQDLHPGAAHRAAVHAHQGAGGPVPAWVPAWPVPLPPDSDLEHFTF